LPRPARPPHDPLTLRLSGADGWRASAALDQVEVDPGDGSLRLVATWPPGLGIDDPWGSLGGVIPPRHVGLAPDGAIYLADIAGRRLLRFDPCTCHFPPLPCLTPPGGELRTLAASADRLYLAAGDRVWVLQRRRWATLATLQPPAGAVPTRWQPKALTLDARCRLWVGDPANGAVHLFDRLGRWRRAVAGLGAVHALAFDTAGRLHVASGAKVRVLDGEGRVVETVERPERLVDRFPPLPFAFDSQGRLALGALCRAFGAPAAGDGLFDEQGKPVAGMLVPFQPGVAGTTGRYLSLALDSRIHRCVWHRVAIRAELPPGTRIALRSRTAELDLPTGLVEDPADSAWSPAEGFGAADVGRGEALIVSPPGRYLWLELTLVGRGDAGPRVREVALEFPRISLRRYLPAVWGGEPVTADVADRLLAIFDSGLRSIESRVDRMAELFDPRSAPATSPRRGPPDALSWLASWVGLSFALGRAEGERRRLLRAAPRLYAERGTAGGLRRMLVLHLGIESRCAPLPARPWQLPCLVLEHWRLRRWLFLGRGRLGDHSRLWGEGVLGRSRLGDSARADVTRLTTERDPLRDPFHAHAHRLTVFLPAARARQKADRRRIEQLVHAEVPAQVQADIRWVEARMRLGGQAMLGFDSVLGRWPAAALTLDQDGLGRATRIAGSGTSPTSFALGRDTRVGRTTRLG
jgi:phage tail-like protein